MKRDWDLVREILTKLEELESNSLELKPGDLDAYSPELVSYHISILSQANLIKARFYHYLDDELDCSAISLTWNGHEFLDQIRSDTAWKKIKELVKSKGLELSIDAIKNAAAIIIARTF